MSLSTRWIDFVADIAALKRKPASRRPVAYRPRAGVHLIETLESRWLMSFSHWSTIGPAIAKVPESAGQLASAKVVNFGTTVYTGPLNVKNTLDRIRADGTPIDSDDGSVYTNPQADGLPVDGTYYEFVVAPSNGTDHKFTFSSPGPMRILVATGGDVFFTGDHYSTFQAVYIYSATPTPTISAFSDSPTTVVSGASTTLSATASESGGTISSVKFYRESNGTSGYQSGDTLVGTGSQSGSTWSISTGTSGFAAGTYTYYAVATDSSGTSTAASSTTLKVTAPAAGSPIIGSFSLSPTSITTGGSTTLTATASETNGTISSVKFYRESNGTSGLQTSGDTLVGTGSQSGSTWTLSTATTGFAAGTYTYYAVATDSTSVSSAASSATLTVTAAATSGAELTWNIAGQSNFGTQGLAATSVASGVTNSLGLTRGSGVATSGSAASNAWGGTNWASTSSAGISGGEYVTFGMTVASGTTLSLGSIDLNYRRSSTGATSGYWQYQLNSGAWTTVGDFSNEFSSTSSSGAAITEINLSGISGLQSLAAGTSVNFRLNPYGASSTGGTWYVYDINNKDLVVNGSTAAAAAKAAASPAAAKASAFSSKAISSSSWAVDMGDAGFWQ